MRGGGANQYFVAIAPPPPTIATFVPYSEHFVALPLAAAMIATNRWLPRLPTQPQLTFAQAYTAGSRSSRTLGDARPAAVAQLT